MTLTPTSAKGGSGGGGGALAQICLVTLGAAQASFDTQTILGGPLPTTYNHLFLKLLARSSGAGSFDTANMQFNADAAANYDYQYTNMTGTSPATFQAQGAPSAALGYFVQSSATAGVASQIDCWIDWYNALAFNKTFLSQVARKLDTSPGDLMVGQVAGFWRNSAAITRITVTPSSGSNFVAGSQFAVYGLT